MKKLLLLMVVMLGILSAHANKTIYNYLSFESIDGEVVSVPVESLNITISGTTLIAGEKTFWLSNLRNMFFSESDKTTDISKLAITDWDNITDIYDLNGRKITRSQIKKGAYIVKSKSGTYKLVVK